MTTPSILPSLQPRALHAPSVFHAVGRLLARTRRPRGAIAAALVALLCALTGGAGDAFGQGTAPGQVDIGFDPGTGATDTVLAVAVQPDGKILVAGLFEAVHGMPRNRIARLNADGSVDNAFDPGTGVDGSVSSLALQPDGKVLVGGWFTSINGVPRNNIARLNADGSVDLSFDPGAGPISDVLCLALQPDGKVVVGGRFWTVDGELRSQIARLNADGSLDASFDPVTVADGNFDGTVHALALQPDGRVLVAGEFSSLDGAPRNGIARLNADGSVDPGFNPPLEADGLGFCLAIQPDGKVFVGGSFGAVNGVPRNNLARLNADGSLDAGFDPGAALNSRVYCVALQTDGKVVMGGDLVTDAGTALGVIVRFMPDGSIDSGFDPGTGAQGPVHSLALQPDGKVLVGGWFTSINGVSRRNIARLGSTGAVDSGFGPGTQSLGAVLALGVQSDGKVLVGGRALNGVRRFIVARVSPDGSLDESFQPWSDGQGGFPVVGAIALQPDGKALVGGALGNINGGVARFLARLNPDASLDESHFNTGSGPNNPVSALGLQPDGKVLVGGLFTSIDGVSRNRIARLNSDGSVDLGFDPGTGADSQLSFLALQPDGKVLVCGYFTTINGVSRNRIARMNPDGSLDASFDPGTGANAAVHSLALQPNGKILVGGSFTSMDGVPRNRIARLNSDGSLDTGFDPGTGANAGVNSVVRQPDGKILLVGDFTSVNGISRNRIARLDADGTVDSSFEVGTGASSSVWTCALQPDGKVLVGGQFNSVNGLVRQNIARLSNGAIDTDGDGTPDTMDACPSNAALTAAVTYYLDFDGDGFGSPLGAQHVCSTTPPSGYAATGGDCNDSSAAVNPSASETCDGANADENCNGVADDADPGAGDAGKSNCFVDLDGDGYGSGSAQRFCDRPAGYAPNGSDNCPLNPDMLDPVAYYFDGDHDGYGNPAAQFIACAITPPLGYVAQSGDCDDADISAYPGAVENCANLGLDNDCDGVNTAAEATDSVAYFVDLDGDGYGTGSATMSCTAIAGSATNSADCNDGNSAAYPAAPELCDGLDNNCDAVIDEGCVAFAVTLEGSATGIAPGETFTVRASCTAPPAPLSGAQLALHFDATRLQLDAVDPVFTSPLGIELAEQIDNTAGTLRYALGSSTMVDELTGAADLCDLTFTVLPGSSMCGAANLVTFGNVGPFTTRFTRSADASPVVPALTNLPPVNLDSTPPVLSGALATDITVPTDAGSVYGAAIPEPTVVAIDDCDSDVSVSRAVTLAGGAVVTEWPAVFPIGISTVEWIAIDDAGNYVSAVRTITVEPYHLLEARVTLNGFMSGHSNREIRFSADGHIFGSIVTIPPGIGGVGITEIALPVAAMHPCVAAKAPTHSLTSTAVPVIVGARYRADFALIQGDSNDDDMIEIVDYAMFVIDSSTAGNFDRPPEARSNFNGDRLVNIVDFSFIGTGFFNVGESCTGALASARPRERISVKELRRAGLGELAAADLNRDGWFDMRDMQSAVQGNAGGNGGAVAQPAAAAEAAGVQW